MFRYQRIAQAAHLSRIHAAYRIREATIGALRPRLRLGFWFRVRRCLRFLHGRFSFLSLSNASSAAFRRLSKQALHPAFSFTFSMIQSTSLAAYPRHAVHTKVYMPGTGTTTANTHIGRSIGSGMEHRQASSPGQHRRCRRLLHYTAAPSADTELGSLACCSTGSTGLGRDHWRPCRSGGTS